MTDYYYHSSLVSRDAIDAACDRTLWSIIWACLLTLFACTWVAIHPNAAYERDSGKIIVARRLGFMLCMLIVPEMVICWALRQWVLATLYAKKFEDDDSGVKWTRTHGFFLIMGGFCYFTEDGNLEVMTAEKLVDFHDKGLIQWPQVSLKQIQDRSKADFLSKFIVVMQTSWFSLQLIVRLAKGLPTTELEITTFAFCVLNLVVYVLWWEKPFDVRAPIIIPVRHMDTMAVPSFRLGMGDEAFKERGFRMELQDSYNGHASEVGEFGGLNPVECIGYSLVFIWELLGDQFGRTNVEKCGDGRMVRGVERYAAGFWYEWVTSRRSQMVVIAIIGSVFGGLHLIAWNFRFQTEAEMWLWRVSSILLACTPIAMVATKYVADRDDDTSGFMTLFFCCMFTYPIARIILIVLPIISLRHPVPGIFVNIKWTSLLPHF